MLAQSVGQPDAGGVLAGAQLVLVRHRTCRCGGAEERAAEPRPFLVGPVDEPHGDGRFPLSASRRITSTPATTFSAPSSQPPFGTESMWPPMSTAWSEAPRSVNH